jgi:hypothetical protein
MSNVASRHQRFDYTGQGQTFTVPAGVNWLTVVALGARGASATGGTNGGRVYAVIPVTPGERLAVFVGGEGSETSGGFNGGGNGGGAAYDCYCHGYGGGGASDIRRGGATLRDRVLVVGGGGGQGGKGSNSTSLGGAGGKGGASIGGAGDAGGNDYAGGGGAGGKQHRSGSGGSGGVAKGSFDCAGASGDAGSRGQGGDGGAGCSGDSGYSYGAGGGGAGGGYYGAGGGGGGSGCNYCGQPGGGGGGGSSYIEPSAKRFQTLARLEKGHEQRPRRLELVAGMKISMLDCRALSIGAAAAMLAGCGGSPSGIAPSATTPQRGAVSEHAGKSGILRGTSGGDLIYATGGCRGICMVAYPAGKRVARIANQADSGVCADSSGNVFVPIGVKVNEYPHGATRPIAELSLPGDSASACSVDPTTGKIAVKFESSSGDIAIFAGAKGRPTVFKTTGINAQYLGYDDSGNLFVDGYLTNFSTGLNELPYEGSAFESITISGNPGKPGQVQWDGTYLTLEGLNKGATLISRLQLVETTATIEGTTQLNKILGRAYQSWIDSGNVYVPYGDDGNRGNANRIGVWSYPSGGDPIKTIMHLGNKNSLDVQGVALSI